jgi:hypothetical protein
MQAFLNTHSSIRKSGERVPLTPTAIPANIRQALRHGKVPIVLWYWFAAEVRTSVPRFSNELYAPPSTLDLGKRHSFVRPSSGY